MLSSPRSLCVRTWGKEGEKRTSMRVERRVKMGVKRGGREVVRSASFCSIESRDCARSSFVRVIGCVHARAKKLGFRE